MFFLIINIVLHDSDTREKVAKGQPMGNNRAETFLEGDIGGRSKTYCTQRINTSPDSIQYDASDIAYCIKYKDK